VLQDKGSEKLENENRLGKEGGREELELPWPRGEVSGGRRATKVALRENSTG
jgi:hypothetical protein